MNKLEELKSACVAHDAAHDAACDAYAAARDAACDAYRAANAAADAYDAYQAELNKPKEV